MKAVIPAAGQGTRLRPVTLTMPKPLVPVANKPLIVHAIDTLKNAGLTEIAIIVSGMDSPIVSTFGDGASLGVQLTYIVQEEQLGLGHAIGMAKDFVGDDSFAVFLGDNLFMDKMVNLLQNFDASPNEASLVLGEVPDPTRFGIAIVEDGKIKGVVEKPKDPPSNLAIAGVYVFRPSIFDAISRIKPSWRGELEITDAIQVLIDEGKTVAPYTIEGWFIDAGKPDPIITANQLVLEQLPYSVSPQEVGDQVEGNSEVSHRVILGKGSRIINSVVRGPVIIGENTTIENSYVGPFTSIGSNTRISNSHIEASIVMDEVEISNVPGRIDRSVIGSQSQILGKGGAAQTNRFVIAEYTLIEM